MGRDARAAAVYSVGVNARQVIILLSCALGISLLALGFLLGRESNRAPVVVAPPVTATQLPVTELPPGPPSINAEPVAVAAPAAARPRPAVDPADKQAVARYFRDVEHLQNTDVDNPEAAASSLLSAASTGDTSGLRKLVADARSAEVKARAVTPPAACAHYHKQLVNVLSDTREMFQSLERGIGGGNMDALPALLNRANATKSRAEALAREEREIKSRFGI